MAPDELSEEEEEEEDDELVLDDDEGVAVAVGVLVALTWAVAADVLSAGSLPAAIWM